MGPAPGPRTLQMVMESKFIRVSGEPISPELVVNRVRTDGSGCVATYVGLIRDNSHGRQVSSVAYEDADGKAEERLGEIAAEIGQRWPVQGVAICHRVGTLKVGDINLVVAVAAGHRREGFAACQYAVDRFKEKLPTGKTETYADGDVLVEG